MLICLGLECFIASCTLPRRIMPLSCSQLMKFGRYINLLELSYMKRKVTIKRDSVCFTSFGLCWNSGLGCCICSSFHIFSIDILLELLILLVVIRGTYSRVYVFVCFVCVCFAWVYLYVFKYGHIRSCVHSYKPLFTYQRLLTDTSIFNTRIPIVNTNTIHRRGEIHREFIYMPFLSDRRAGGGQ